MKTEIREVTVKKEVYIADDGTVFEDEEECAEYELELFEKDLRLYNFRFKKVDHADECTYANLITANDVINFKKACKWYGLVNVGLNEPGIYTFSCFRDYWINMDDVIIRIRGGLTND